MTPGQARIALLSFLLVTAGVAANALFLQARPPAAAQGGTADRRIDRPAPDKAGKLGEAARRRVRAAAGRPRSSAAHRSLCPGLGKHRPRAGAAGTTAECETIRAIQRELKPRGYGPVAGDGVMGLTTRAAIMAFEHDHGLALTGEASEALLKRILLGARGPRQRRQPRPRKARSATAEQVIRVRAAAGWRRSATSRAASTAGSARIPCGPSAISRWTRALRAQGPHLGRAAGAPDGSCGAAGKSTSSR